jgi:signal transduction histidine kinase
VIDKSIDINNIFNKKSCINKAPNEWANIFSSMSDMVTIHDKDFNIICANAAAETNLTLPSLASGKTKCFKYYHGTSCPPEGCPSCKCLKTGIPGTFELYEPHLKKYIEIRALPRFDRENQIIGIIHIVRDITKQKMSEKMLRDAGIQLHNLTAHLLTAREEERKCIARDIHDELGQSVTALKMDLIIFDRHLHTDLQTRHKIKSMLDAIDMIIHKVQRISSELRPQLLYELGLTSAIKLHLKKIRNQTGITCRFESNFENINANYNCNIVLFRIFQEALTNVCRHANATKVKVILKEDAEQLMMEIMDNGKGITEDQITNATSLGITGMKERVHALRGTLEINGILNKGTRVLATIPLDGSKNKKNRLRSIKKAQRKSNIIRPQSKCCYDDHSHL